MKMMSCTAELRDDGRLHIGLPKSAFVHTVEDLREHSDAKIWIPDESVIEVRDIVVEFRVRQEIRL